MEDGGYFDTKNLDVCSQILKITPHAGGMESKDFCSILLRAIEKYLTNNKVKYKVIEKTEFNIVIEFLEKNNFLSFMSGIIKLVRVSPFGKGDKIHTSYCKITVEEVKEKKEIEVLNKDLKWDYFKSPGPGGQNKNKTMSAVRLVHIPTNTTVISCSERSQNDNKKKALEQMRTELNKKDNLLLFENKKTNWENSIKPEDSFLSIYYNHKMIYNEKTGTKTNRLKEFLNGQLDFIK